MESPTRVGNTRCHRTMRWRTSVHPHACGEYPDRYARSGLSVGSSPRVWGILPLVAQGKGYVRFIPTRVGNTFLFRALGESSSVHPHACGEYRRAEQAATHTVGSSPRVWGILGSQSTWLLCHRFIPTRVGNTRSTLFSFMRCAVHPHACGEYRPYQAGTLRLYGSSPRVWGILGFGMSVHFSRRFIPTRVGNTPLPPPNGHMAAVHPHACGEYPWRAWQAADVAGSSPRVWGILGHLLGQLFIGRFIPTRVGNTSWNGSLKAACAVHPHACGEYSSGRCKK